MTRLTGTVRRVLLAAFVAMRIVRSRRSPTLSLVTGISIVGIAFGVLALTVVLGVTDGFRQSFEERILGLRNATLEAILAFLEPHRAELAVSDLRRAVHLIILAAEGIGHGATRRELDTGIAAEFNKTAVGYLLGPEARDAGQLQRGLSIPG